ncbi:unnamed protein product [Xylocopa violacea]|uniref:Uncharacterized protein n=1 Tax=Xylocopa violacea TaxID=135666 RepID=A0ABP1NTA0_XYLVO
MRDDDAGGPRYVEAVPRVSVCVFALNLDEDTSSPDNGELGKRVFIVGPGREREREREESRLKGFSRRGLALMFQRLTTSTAKKRPPEGARKWKTLI